MADEDLDHQPIAVDGEDCICLAVTDAPEVSNACTQIMQPFQRLKPGPLVQPLVCSQLLYCWFFVLVLKTGVDKQQSTTTPPDSLIKSERHIHPIPDLSMSSLRGIYPETR